MQSSRTFRIFVSSTFSDLKAERNALQEKVFPRLRALAAAHACRFQAIDLRWGVSEEAALDQQTMKICLGEIERCQKTSPRPNFVVLLGDRYGWQPLPFVIPSEEFERLLREIAGSDRELILQWYRRDDNCLPPVYQLQGRMGEWVSANVWGGVEAHLRSILFTAARMSGLSEAQLVKYETSATEQEILHGAIQVVDAREHIFCYAREIPGIPTDGTAGEYLDLEQGIPDALAMQKLVDLKMRLKQVLGENYHEYHAKWDGDKPTTDHIEQLCQDVYESLKRIILSEIERPHAGPNQELVEGHIRTHPALDVEGRAHRDFAEERTRFFIGRTAILKKIGTYLNNGQGRILAIRGKGGSGKSALLAKAIEQAQKSSPGAALIYRFIGATPASSDGRSLLESLCQEISRCYGISQRDVPVSYQELVSEFGKRMALASPSRPLVLFLDSLDQLSNSQNARNLAWLPRDLPPHVFVVVSSREDDTWENLGTKSHQAETLDGLSRDEGADLLSMWLSNASRTLQPDQMNAVLKNFDASGGNPLFLKLAFEEARLWTSFQPAEELTPGVGGIIEKNMIARLKFEGNHGDELVSHALGYLAVARQGLAEDELVDLLSRDPQVYASFFLKSFHLPVDLVRWAVAIRRETGGQLTGYEEITPAEEQAAIAWLNGMRERREDLLSFLERVLPKEDGPRLPVVLWARLSFDLSPFLNTVLVDGIPMLNFYHRELEVVSRSLFHSGGQEANYHRKLAEYFRRKADPAGDRSWNGHDRHGLSELPYHLTKAGSFDDLFLQLTDFRFLERKATEVGVLTQKNEAGKYETTCTGVLRLQDDYDLALSAMPGLAKGAENTRAALFYAYINACALALGREAHVLVKHPDLIWPQLFNRLQWSMDPAVLPLLHEMDQGKRSGNNLWICLDTPHREAESLMRTLSDHRFWVFSCAFSSDGRLILSGGRDNTIRIWNSHDGSLVRTLTGHTNAVSACAFLPDDQRLLSVGWDGTMRVWNSLTGGLQRTWKVTNHIPKVEKPGQFAGPGPQQPDINSVAALSMSPDGARVVTGSWDGKLRIWDLVDEVPTRILDGHEMPITACAWSPDGTRIASASQDGTVRIWQLTDGKMICSLSHHSGAVRACAYSPDGRSLLSGGNDGSLCLWDSNTGEMLKAIAASTRAVHACAFTPDGRYLLAAGADNCIHLFDGAEGTKKEVFQSHIMDVDDIRCSPDGRLLLSASKDKTVKMWQLTPAEGRRPFWGHTQSGNGCQFSPDGGSILTGGFDGKLMIWSNTGKEPPRILSNDAGQIVACGFFPDGRHIFTFGTEDRIRIWDASTGEKKDELINEKAQETLGRDCTISPDGRYILTASGYTPLRLWDISSRTLIRSLEGHRDEVRACCFSPDGRLAASAGRSGEVILHNADTGEIVRKWNGHTDLVEVCLFSRDGNYLLTAGWDRTIRVWDHKTGQILHTMEQPGGVVALEFSHDGKYLLASVYDRWLFVWDVQHWSQLTRLYLPVNIRKIAAHPRKNLWACTGLGGAMYVFHLEGI